MAYYVGDALEELRKIKALPDGHLDFATLPTFAKKTKTLRADSGEKDKDGKAVLTEVVTEERNLGAMISMLTVAIQQLTERIEKLEGS
jgi:hypothetical protein